MSSNNSPTAFVNSRFEVRAMSTDSRGAGGDLSLSTESDLPQLGKASKPCDKKSRRVLPMQLRIPLQDIWSFRRIRKQRKKSTKSKASVSSFDKENSGAHPVDDDSDLVSRDSSQPNSSIGGLLICSVCFNEHESCMFPKLIMCEHKCCIDCLRRYLHTEIYDSRVNITCPECPTMIHPNDIKSILNDDNLLEKYEIFMLRRHLTCEPDTRWCPAVDCHYGVIAAGCASCPRLKCDRPGCGTSFCYHCRQIWHPNKTCDDARVERTSLIMKASTSEELQQLDTKPCPRCNTMIAKLEDGSCNHMTCAICGAEFCWLCMKQISDLHYLSPSGCTFWGKKPWSRKKKVLWQIGTLIGAPLGIALIAGLTIPAMMIGIPIYVGRKLFKRYTTSPKLSRTVSKSRRNFIIVIGVTASIIVAPILAALTVSVGVPILLAYVYGVVPISLCRTGGCGITKTENGVRLDMDEAGENADLSHYMRGDSNRNERMSLGSITGTSGSVASGAVSVHDMIGSNRGDNGDCDSRKSVNTRKLSILSELTTEEEDSSGRGGGARRGKKGAAMSASVVHIERETDCVSNTAIAGESLTGSICGSTGYNPNVKLRKNSIGSDSMNFSLCDNVSNITYPESLAGAIIDTSSSAVACTGVGALVEETTTDLNNGCEPQPAPPVERKRQLSTSGSAGSGSARSSLDRRAANKKRATPAAPSASSLPQNSSCLKVSSSSSKRSTKVSIRSNSQSSVPTTSSSSSQKSASNKGCAPNSPSKTLPTDPLISKSSSKKK